MEEIVDYFISEVKYSEKGGEILQLKTHINLYGSISRAKIEPRDEIIGKIKHGLHYLTVHFGPDLKMKPGEKVKLVSVNGNEYLRTDNEQKASDDLGKTAEF